MNETGRPTVAFGLAPLPVPAGGVLIIGTSGAALPGLRPGTRVTEAGFADLAPALLARLRPGAVACPLFGAGFDASQVIERLGAIGYRGELQVLCPDLPRPGLVEAELASLHPGIRVTLVLT